MDTLTGAVVVDKPAAWTSHDAVNRVRRLAQTKKVGHLGTLDPLATGVLPLLIGRATRLAQFFSKGRKTYDATVRFGFATTTYDAEGAAVGPATEVVLNCEQLRSAVAALVGSQMQQPPPVSAKKIGGVPAYKLVRRNKAVDLAPVPVEIFQASVLRCEGAEADIHVVCSAGTYMRSIAHDLGIQFGVGAHLTRLRRLASGEFEIDQAYTLDELARMREQNRFEDCVIPAARLLPEVPVQAVDSATAGAIRQGRSFRTSPFNSDGNSPLIKAVTIEGELIAIGRAAMPHVYQPILVL